MSKARAECHVKGLGRMSCQSSGSGNVHSGKVSSHPFMQLQFLVPFY